MKPIDLVGQRFTRLLVLSRATNTSGGQARFLCACDCGVSKVFRGDLLRSGATRSCGCFRRETVGGKPTHGLSRSTTYSSWASMKDRCNNTRSDAYGQYGGRGITVCERWMTFEGFLADMGERPHGRSLDRINNDGNYEPSNCRWATWSEQQRNKRRFNQHDGHRLNNKLEVA